MLAVPTASSDRHHAGRFRPGAALAIGVFALCLAAASSARAGVGIGAQAGMSMGPQRMMIGGHLAMRNIAHQVSFFPNADISFGDGYTIITLNPEFQYRLPMDGRREAFVGGSISLVHYRFDLGLDDVAFSLTRPAVVLTGGIEQPMGSGRGFVHLGVGLSTWYPDARLAVGFTFGQS